MNNLLPLLPAGIVGCTILLVMVVLALHRSHKLVVLCTAVGLNAALISILLQLGQRLPTGAVTALFIVDNFALVNGALILVSALACITFAYDYFAKLTTHKEELYVLLLTATLGALLMVSAQHMATFFMALELLSVPMYGMLALTFTHDKSLESGLKYLILSAAASATLLMGMAFVFVATGTLTFAGMGQQLGQLGASPLLILGAALMLSAIAFKLSLAPFHAWAGDVYEGAPVPVTAFLGSVSKVAMVALAVRLLLETSLPAFVVVDKVVVVLIVLSVLIGNLLALKQVSLKRMLAYSSVAHMGYALMALAALGLQADTLTTMYMIIYALTTLASFGVIALMSQTVHGIEADNVAVYQGLFWRRPVLTAVMTVALLSLAGIPSTAGFMTKVQIMLALVQSGRFWLGGLLIIGSAISLYYYLGVILMMYKRPLATIDFDVADNWRSRAGGVVLLLISGLLLWWGVLPNSLYTLAQLAQIAH